MKAEKVEKLELEILVKNDIVIKSIKFYDLSLGNREVYSIVKKHRIEDYEIKKVSLEQLSNTYYLLDKELVKHFCKKFNVVEYKYYNENYKKFIDYMLSKVLESNLVRYLAKVIENKLSKLLYLEKETEIIEILEKIRKVKSYYEHKDFIKLIEELSELVNNKLDLKVVINLASSEELDYRVYNYKHCCKAFIVKNKRLIVNKEIFDLYMFKKAYKIIEKFAKDSYVKYVIYDEISKKIIIDKDLLEMYNSLAEYLDNLRYKFKEDIIEEAKNRLKEAYLKKINVKDKEYSEEELEELHSYLNSMYECINKTYINKYNKLDIEFDIIDNNKVIRVSKNNYIIIEMILCKNKEIVKVYKKLNVNKLKSIINKALLEITF